MHTSRVCDMGQERQWGYSVRIEADGWRVNADSVRRLLDSLLRGTFANEFAIFLDLSSQLVKGLSRGCCDRVLIGCGDPSD